MGRRRMKGKTEAARSVDYLLYDLCVRKWGFCNRLTAEQLFRTHPILTADLFTRAVLEAEGMDPDTEETWFKRIRGYFLEKFGPAISSTPIPPQPSA